MKPKRIKVLISVPEPLLRKIDAAARIQERDRSREVCLRLQQTLKPKASVKGAA